MGQIRYLILWKIRKIYWIPGKRIGKKKKTGGKQGCGTLRIEGNFCASDKKNRGGPLCFHWKKYSSPLRKICRPVNVLSYFILAYISLF
jgi:hypothetical protein